MFGFSQGSAAYQNTRVSAQAAGEDIQGQILMLLDGALEELEYLRGHLEAKRFSEKGLSVDRLLRILGGLEAALDIEKGGELAQDLRNLYQHCGKSLLKISAVSGDEMANQSENISHIVTILSNIREGWQGISKAD